MDGAVVERKRRGLAVALEHMPAVAEKIRYRVKPINLANCYSGLGGDHLTVGLFDYFVSGNLQSLKQNLHVACQLKFAAISLDSFQRFTVGEELFYAILSDSPTIISTVASLQPPDFVSARGSPANPQFLTHMWQLVLQRDYAALEAKVATFARSAPRKEDRQLASEGKDFFTLLMRGDKAELEALIGRHARIKSQDVLTEAYMCYQGTLEAKLSWIAGIPVHVDSPLLPMDLLPVRPLEQYDDVYDFLKPGWEPPKQNPIEKLTRWYRARTASKRIIEER